MSVATTGTRPAAAGGGGGKGRGTRVATGEQPPARRGRGCLMALARAFPWALGAAIGVAAGAYLTAVGGAGAPGASALDAWADLVVLPGVAFAAMLVAHLIAQAVWAGLRSLLGGRREGGPAQAEPPG